MNIVFSTMSFEEFTEWQNTDKKIYKKIASLIKEISRTPFTGTGKPEPLKGDLSGYWSRRIDDKNRLVYRVTEAQIEIIQCKGHYND